MTIRPTLFVAAAVAALAGPAAAQFGDTALSYKDGIVYDDDLVPGRGPNQPFDADLFDRFGSPGVVVVGPRSSPDLIQDRAAMRREQQFFRDAQDDALQRSVARGR